MVIGESPRNGRGSPRGAIAERRGEGASESCGAPEDRGVVLGEHVVVDAWARAVGRRAADRAAGDGARRRARADRVTLEVRARDELALQVVRPDLAGLPHRDLAGARRRTRSGANEGSGGEEQTEHRKLTPISDLRTLRVGALGSHVTVLPFRCGTPRCTESWLRSSAASSAAMLLLSLFAPPSVVSLRSTEQLNRIANRAIKVGRHQDALKCYETALTSGSDPCRTPLLHALHLQRMQRPSAQVRAAFSQGAFIDRGNPRLLAELLIAWGLFESKQAEMGRAVRLLRGRRAEGRGVVVAARQGGERPRSRATSSDDGEASEHCRLSTNSGRPPRFWCAISLSRALGCSDASTKRVSARSTVGCGEQ